MAIKVTNRNTGKTVQIKRRPPVKNIRRVAKAKRRMV